jgi:hypothetical protein
MHPPNLALPKINLFWLGNLNPALDFGPSDYPFDYRLQFFHVFGFPANLQSEQFAIGTTNAFHVSIRP